MPVKDKARLVAALREAIRETEAYCGERGIHPDRVIAAAGFEKVRLLDDAVEAILTNDESKKLFQALTNTVDLLYRAILPDPLAGEFEPRVVLFSLIAEKIRSLTPPANIDEIMAEVEELLDASIAPRGYVIQEARAGYDATAIIDLNQIDFDALRKRFAQGRKHTEIEKLRAAISRKLARMVEQNKTRMDYLERFQQLIDEYNAGSKNVQVIFDELLAFTQQLNEEEQRAVKLGLSEEELAVFDLLTKPDPGLTVREEASVRKLAAELLATLKREKLVLDWRKRQQTRADVLLTIEQVLDGGLPRAYTPEDYRQRCAVVYEYVYDSYSGSGGAYSAGY